MGGHHGGVLPVGDHEMRKDRRPTIVHPSGPSPDDLTYEKVSDAFDRLGPAKTRPVPRGPDQMGDPNPQLARRLCRHARHPPHPSRARSRQESIALIAVQAPPHSTRYSTSTAANARLADQRDRLRNEIGVLSKQVGGLHRDGHKDEADALQDAEPRARRGREGARRRGRRAGAARTRRAARHPQLPGRRVPRRRRRATTSCCAARGSTPPPTATHQRVPHWDIGERARHPRPRARRQAVGLDVRDVPRARARRSCGRSCQLALDRNADALRGDPAADAGAHRDDGLAPATCPSSSDDAYHLERDDLWAIPTAEVPLTSLAPRRDPRRGDAAAAAAWPTRRASAARRARPAATPAGLLRVHEFDKVEILAYADARAGGRDARRDPRSGPRRSSRDLGPRVPHRSTSAPATSAARRRRTFDIEVYAPGCRPLARGVVGVVVQRLPGPAGQRPLPARRARRAPRSCTRSTARRWRCHGCGRRWSRRTASPTARSGCPRCCTRTCEVSIVSADPCEVICRALHTGSRWRALLGAVARYSIGRAVGVTRFPWATLAINLSGSFALAAVLTTIVHRRVSADLATAISCRLPRRVHDILDLCLGDLRHGQNRSSGRGHGLRGRVDCRRHRGGVAGASRTRSIVAKG